jgi:hypothetical protein
VLTVGFLALGTAFYLRYLVIENTQVGLSCDAGVDTTLCLVRLATTRLFNAQVFGWIAVGAAVINLIRPAVPLFALALAATAVGLVLYNSGVAGWAGALVFMSFARPAREPM